MLDLSPYFKARDEMQAALAAARQTIEVTAAPMAQVAAHLEQSLGYMKKETGK